MRAFPAGIVPNPHDRLQSAVLSQHMYEDELERQKERYMDAFMRLQVVAPREAATTLDAWRVALFESKPQSVRDQIKADPIWAVAAIPDDALREES